MEDNPYSRLMFDKRDEWIPAYFHDVFCAGICTTQRNESMNVAMKILLGSNTYLYEFATKFEKMVENVYERESDEDFQTLNETSQLWSDDAIEIEARKVYTRSIFTIFKKKMKKYVSLWVREVKRERLYEVRPTKMHSTYQWYKPNCMVLIDRPNARIDCECKGFLYQGVLYSHALVVMRHVGLESYLTSLYILKRWTHDANASTKRGINNHDIQSNELQSVKRNVLTKRMNIIVNKTLENHVAYDMAYRSLDKLTEGLTKFIEGNVEGRRTNQITCTTKVLVEDSQAFSDPSLSQCKGKRKPNRFKIPADVRVAKKIQTCFYCSKKTSQLEKLSRENQG